ncbi:MAG: hypothetical protein F4X26_08505 [Chloroflexi bacterium]|nr:hypothetical protein [Chloroflexota bacterium]
MGRATTPPSPTSRRAAPRRPQPPRPPPAPPQPPRPPRTPPTPRPATTTAPLLARWLLATPGSTAATRATWTRRPGSRWWSARRTSAWARSAWRS